MSPVVAVLLYKIICLLVGLGFGFMGFWLFICNIWGDSGNFETKYQNFKIVLKAGAPGTFFALFGAAIIIAAVKSGYTINDVKRLSDVKQAYQNQQMPSSPPTGQMPSSPPTGR